MMKKKIVVFDLDGTVTYKDTFLDFILYTQGPFRFFLGFFIHIPYLVAYKLKIYPNWKAKQAIFSFFFKDIPLEKFNCWGEEFISGIDSICRTKAMETIKKYQKEGIPVWIVSASVENWILPWATKHGLQVLGTRVDVDEYGKLTGKLLGKNCYGQEKVNRLLNVYPDRESYILISYGDSQGDKELIEFSDKGFYKYF